MMMVSGIYDFNCGGSCEIQFSHLFTTFNKGSKKFRNKFSWKSMNQSKKRSSPIFHQPFRIVIKLLPHNLTTAQTYSTAASHYNTKGYNSNKNVDENKKLNEFNADII